MPNFTQEAPIKLSLAGNTNGNYDIVLDAGRRYVCDLKGTFDSCTVTIQAWSEPIGAYANVINGALSAAAEFTFYAVHNKYRFVTATTGANTSLGLTIVRIHE